MDGIHNEKWCATDKARLCVVCALKDLLESYADRGSSNVSDDVRDRLQTVMENSILDDDPMAEDIKAQIQSDPFDFLRYLVHELQTHESTESDVTAADLFDVEAKTESKCDKCGDIKTGEDKKVASEGDVGLMLNIREPQTGLRMTAYLGHSEYKFSRQARCESTTCNEEHGVERGGSKREVRKYVTKAPELLVIRLNRFATGVKDPVTERLEEVKISNPVSFEEYINMGEFTRSGAPIFYQLHGVIGHSGDRTSSGHYVAAVRKPDGSTFCSINDDKAISEDRGCNVDELYRIRNMHGDFDPYVLFYSKV